MPRNNLCKEIGIVEKCFDTVEYLQEDKQFGKDSIEELRNPTQWGFAPYDGSKMYDFFVGGQLDRWMQAGICVAEQMGNNIGPFISVTKIDVHTEVLPQTFLIPGKTLPSLYKKLLPPPGFGVVLRDYVTDHDLQRWYDKADLNEEEQDEMHNSWSTLKSLGVEVNNEMKKWGCIKEQPIGWSLVIIR